MRIGAQLRDRSSRNIAAAAGEIALYVVLTAWAVVVILPVYWMIVTSLKPQSLLLEVPPELFPRSPTLQHFRDLFTTAPIFRWGFNSIIVSVTITAGAVLSDSLAGYSYAIVKPIGYQVMFWLVLICLMIPDQIRTIPLFMLLNSLGFYNTYAGLIIPFMGSAFGMFLMRQYMRGISREFIDAAKTEGCGEFRIYWHIVMPIAKPVVAAATILFFVGNWNTLFWPLVLTSTSEMRTLPVGLSTMQSLYLVNYGVMMAGAVVVAIPVVILFLLLQQYFTKGVTLGGVKE
jgi:multiple sugar transport system permease protein